MWVLWICLRELGPKTPKNYCFHSIFNFIDMLHCCLFIVRLKYIRCSWYAYIVGISHNIEMRGKYGVFSGSYNPVLGLNTEI